MRHAKLCPVRRCEAVIYVDRACCRQHWALASARLRGRWRRAAAAWRVVQASGDADAQRAALAVLTAATEATLAYIHAMIDGKSPHHMGRIAKRMMQEERVIADHLKENTSIISLY